MVTRLQVGRWLDNDLLVAGKAGFDFGFITHYCTRSYHAVMGNVLPVDDEHTCDTGAFDDGAIWNTQTLPGTGDKLDIDKLAAL